MKVTNMVQNFLLDQLHKRKMAIRSIDISAFQKLKHKSITMTIVVGEHIVLLSEHGSVYIGHVTLDSN